MTMTDDLIKLQQLRVDGALTEAEFDRAKAAIINPGKDDARRQVSLGSPVAQINQSTPPRKTRHLTAADIQLVAADYYYNESFKRSTAADGSLKLVPAWNWGAFFGGSLWFLYRKMYLEFVISIFVYIPFWFIAWPLGGLLGNFLYFSHIQRSLQLLSTAAESRSKDLSEMPELSSIRGVNWWVIPIAALFSLFVVGNCIGALAA